MKYLVIGYGNTLRGDDGVGSQAAEIVDSWQLPQVRSLSVHQLTPDLAVEIAQVDCVLFIDAVPVPSDTVPTVTVQSLLPEAVTPTLDHSSHPRSLLALSQALYDQTPKAIWVLIPATHFEFGEIFSPVAERGLSDALAILKDLLTANTTLCTKSA